MKKDDEYDVEKDNLNLCHARADYLIRKHGSIENIPKSSDRRTGERKSLKDIINVPIKSIGICSNPDSTINKYLQEAKENGYSVKTGFKRMNKTDRWNYFISFLRENDYYPTP